MEISTQPKPPKRQDTLGPATPIQDWEVERATVMVESKSSREKAERLEKLLETERKVHEKNTLSLLREVKLKESTLEKKLKDTEDGLMEQILALQRELDEEKSSRQEEILDIRAQHDATLESEDKKYQRRLTALQERLNAKDEEYTQLLKEEQEKNDSGNNDEKEKIIESLNLKLAKAKEQNAELLKESEFFKQASENIQNESNTLQELELSITTLKEQLESAESNSKQYQEQEQNHLQKIQHLEKELESSHKSLKKFKKRLDHTLSGHDAHIKELSDKFMSEAQQSDMTNQAKFQNLISEHKEILRELREQHQTEREVWEIEQKAMLDEIRRDYTFEKEEALRALEKEWNDKNGDLHASMSKDAMEIQKHWENKLQEAKSKSLLQNSRLQGEMEVIKDRLGGEITRRKQNQSALNELLEKSNILGEQAKKSLLDCKELKKTTIALRKENDKLNTIQHSAERYAANLIAITSPSEKIDKNANLCDLLKTAVYNVSIMKYMETNQSYQDTKFDLDTIPTYSF